VDATLVPPPAGESRLAQRLTALSIAAALTAAAWIGGAVRPAHGLHGRYFTNATWSGPPAFERLDSDITSALLAELPVSVWQTYSIEWSGSLVVMRPGEYTIATASDDGSEVVLADRQVVDNLGVHTRTFQSARVHLERGVHPIRVRYAQEGGRYAFELLWARAGDAPRTIPARALVPGEPSMAAYLAGEARPWAVGFVIVAALALAIARFQPWLARFAASHRGVALARRLDALERPHAALAVIWLLGGSIRLLLLFSAQPVVWPDSLLFHETSRSILDGRPFEHDAYRTLAYPFLLAALRWWTEPPVTGLGVLVAQHLIGLAGASCFYLVGRRAFGPLAALAGVVVYALHPVTLFYELSILTETLFTCALAVALWVVVRLTDTPSWWRGVAAGVVCGAAVLVRPVAQWFVAIPLLLAVIVRAPWQSRLAAGAGLLAAYGAVLVPWMAINQREFGFFGVSLGPGMGVYIRVFEVDGLTPPATTEGTEIHGLWAFAQTEGWSANRVRDELDYTRRYSSVDAERLMLAFARDTIAAHPWRFTIATVRQWLVQLIDPNRGAHLCRASGIVVACSGRSTLDELPPFAVATPPGANVPGRWLAWWLTSTPVPMGAVVLLAGAGVAALVVRGLTANPVAALLVATAAYYTLIPALSQWPQDRYRLPVDAILFMLAAYGACVLANVRPKVASESSDHTLL
jgi:hypothetical protein